MKLSEWKGKFLTMDNNGDLMNDYTNYEAAIKAAKISTRKDMDESEAEDSEVAIYKLVAIVSTTTEVVTA